jgi:CheY-like chemotaxis protein
MAKILIIDDDPDIVLAVRLCLEDAGHEVLEAGNGTEGLGKIKAERPSCAALTPRRSTQNSATSRS